MGQRLRASANGKVMTCQCMVRVGNSRMIAPQHLLVDSQRTLIHFSCFVVLVFELVDPGEAALCCGYKRKILRKAPLVKVQRLDIHVLGIANSLPLHV